jgi:hypothetical protein
MRGLFRANPVDMMLVVWTTWGCVSHDGHLGQGDAWGAPDPTPLALLLLVSVEMSCRSVGADGSCERTTHIVRPTRKGSWAAPQTIPKPYLIGLYSVD